MALRNPENPTEVAERLFELHDGDYDTLMAIYDFLGFLYHLTVFTVPEIAPELTDGDQSPEVILEILGELIRDFPSESSVKVEDEKLLRALVAWGKKVKRESFEVSYSEIEVIKKMLYQVIINNPVTNRRLEEVSEKIDQNIRKNR